MFSFFSPIGDWLDYYWRGERTSVLNFKGSLRPIFTVKHYETLEKAITHNKPHSRCPSTFQALFPMFLVPGTIVKSLHKMLKFEDLKERNWLIKVKRVYRGEDPGTTVLHHLGEDSENNYSPYQILEVSHGDKEFYLHSGEHRVIFCSHRWCQDHPDDPNCSQLRKLQSYIRDTDLVWIDYMCVPQTRENESQQKAAILSLPYYIGHSDEFYVLYGDEKNFREYKTRAFTNLEIACATLPLVRMTVITAFVTATSGHRLCPVISTVERKQLTLPYCNPARGLLTKEDDRVQICEVLGHLINACESVSGSDEYIAFLRS